jgi:hypothetical protein
MKAALFSERERARARERERERDVLDVSGVVIRKPRYSLPQLLALLKPPERERARARE